MWTFCLCVNLPIERVYSLDNKYITTVLLQDLQPPKENFIEVIAMKDCGNLMTMSGPRHVRKDEVHVVRSYDAEPLIRCGWLRQVTEKN
jgi:hypothetical protein